LPGRLSPKSNMASGVARHIVHIQRQAMPVNKVILPQARGRCGQYFGGRTPNGGLRLRDQVGDAASVVGMVVRD